MVNPRGNLLMIVTVLSGFAADAVTSCTLKGSVFFGFPTWYRYLPGIADGNGGCIPNLISIGNVWLIVAAVIDMLLYVVGLIAIGFIVYSGFLFITSQGEPDNIKKARDTLWDALIGLAIAVVATATVTFIASRFS